MMKKIGKIKLSSEIVLDNTLGLLPMFTKFVPIHIERPLNYDGFIYTGICDDFEVCKEGEIIPFYSCVIFADTKEVIFEKYQS